MRKIAGGVLLWLTLVGGIAAHTGVLLVDVDAEEGPRIVVPVPLVVARAGLALAPDDVQWIRAPEVAGYLSHAREIGEALRGAGDGTLLAVIDGEERVTITREGPVLRVLAVDGSTSRADVTLPLASLESALRAYDVGERSFRTSELVAALADAPRGDLVHVVDGGDRVRVRRIL